MQKKRKIAFLPLMLLILSGWIQLTPIASISPEQRKYLTDQHQWADSVLATMTLDEKIGQLFVIAAYSNRDEGHYQEVEHLVRNYYVGGILFFQGEPVQQAILTNRYQHASRIPLFITIDAEWGLGMRLDNTMSFPKQITLGAIQDDYLIELMGEEIGRQCRRIGVNVNFAPVADINTNPENPVINYRSFGEATNNVSAKAAAYARGLQNMKVLASAKHFPGHGDTDTDSHLAMPVVNKSKNQLWEVELQPFQQLIADSVGSVLTGHLFVPGLDNRTNRSGTVSGKIVTDLLRNEMGFNGLAITDALVMKGLTRYYSNGNAELEALKAGNDLLLQPGSLPLAFNKIKAAIASGEITELELNGHILRILKSKYWAGLPQRTDIDLNNIYGDINNEAAQSLKAELYDNAVTVVRNEDSLIPFVQLDTTTFASISVSPNSQSSFQNGLSRYADFHHLTIPFKPSKMADWQGVADEAAQSDVVVIGIHDTNSIRSRNYGISPETVDLINYLQKRTKVIVCVFGNPYGLRLFEDATYLVCGYEDEPEAHRSVAQVLFGGLPARGTLPVSINRNIKVGTGIFTASLGRLHFDNAAKVGIDINRMKAIDNIAQEGIAQGAFPGCQVLVARKGVVVYDKAYGNLRYGTNERVTDETIYDLASVTKVSATLQAVMFLNERGEIDLNQRASYYLPELRGTNKESMLVGEILLHQAGLKSFIPFWANTKTPGGSFKSDFYHFQPGGGYLQVANSLYITPAIKDSVLKWIAESPMTSRADRNGGYRYLYSDLGLILLQHIVERQVNMPLDAFVEQNFYEPLGMTTTMYNPLRKFPVNRIAPTEYDTVFRESQIDGTVHDPNAALLGGVAGHAGLFSSAWDLAKLYQMNLNKGIYADRRYLFPETVPHFATNFTDKSHRGLGWNKPTGEESASVAATASPNTYGHTGFTGTVVWVDPDKELIFIMLSNRVYPNDRNNKLQQLQIRRRMHEAVYNSIVYL